VQVGFTVVRYKTRPECADDNQALIEQVFAELDASRPAGLGYMSFRLGGGVSFLHIASIETADATNPLADTAAFAIFQQEIAERCKEPPLVMKATLVGSYRFSPTDPEPRQK
jgi:hypothetical protein